MGRGGGHGDNGNSDDDSNGGGNVVAMEARRAGVGHRDEIGWGEEEVVVTTAAAMSSRKGRCTTRQEGGWQTVQGIAVATEVDNDGNDRCDRTTRVAVHDEIPCS